MTASESSEASGDTAIARTPSQRLTAAIHALGDAFNGEHAGVAMSAGELAALRRLDSEAPWNAEFYRRTAWLESEFGLELAADGSDRDDDERRWAVILNGMAICAGLHRRGTPAGAALAHCLSEARFVRLMQARGPSLRALVRTTARQLASAGERVDWTGIARLVLSEGQVSEESVRRDIARAYFGEVHKQSKASSSGDD